MKLSLQLYSVRKDIEKHGLKKVLADIAAAGFDGVETAGFYGLGAAGLKKELDAAGLTVTSAHIQYDEVVNDTDAVIEDMRVLGFSDAVIPWLSREDLVTKMPEIAEKTKAALKKLNANGFRLGYHNHKHEFIGGEDCVKKYLSAVDGLMFEPDICWLTAAGMPTAEYVSAYRDRLVSIHFKELGESEAENPVLGQGRAPAAECIRLAAEAGLEYIVLEFEGADIPYNEYLKKSAAFMKEELGKQIKKGE